MDKPQTGLLLLEYFKKQKITLSSIAKAMGYSRETLSRRLNDNNIDDLFLWKLSRASGINLSAVLNHEAAMEEDCKSKISRLESDLEAANKTIRDLSATLRALSEKS